MIIVKPALADTIIKKLKFKKYWSSGYYKKNPDKRKKKTAWQRIWIQNNPHRVTQYRETVKAKAAKLRAEVRQLKASTPCMDCNTIFPPECMDFDHRDPKTKRYTISNVLSQIYTRHIIFTEIAKCDLVCANCHRIRTERRKREKS